MTKPNDLYEAALAHKTAEFLGRRLIIARDLGIPEGTFSKSLRFDGQAANRDIEVVRQLSREVLEAAIDLAVKREELLAVKNKAWEEIRARASAPPLLAEFFISLLAPKNTAQALLGDLQEMFAKNVERLGEKQARRKYWMQVAASAGPLLLQWVWRISFFKILVDYFRSKLGL